MHRELSGKIRAMSPAQDGSGRLALLLVAALAIAFTSGIEVATRRGVYLVREVKRSGKRSLRAAEFLRGFPLPVGTRLS